MADRVPLEGVESLMFVLGGVLGLLLTKQDYPLLIVLLTIVILGVILGVIVEFLRIKNKIHF